MKFIANKVFYQNLALIICIINMALIPLSSGLAGKTSHFLGAQNILRSKDEDASSKNVGEKESPKGSISHGQLVDDLFKSGSCHKVPELNIINQKFYSLIDEQKKDILPAPKNNTYENQKFGMGDSAYLFDYLDAPLEFPIINAFEKLWENAKKQPIDLTNQTNRNDPKNYNPYSLQVLYNSTESDKFLFCEIKKIRKNFNETIWNDSITLPQFRQAAGNWIYAHNKNDPIKFIFDMHDYNGDGRLSRKEFILAFLNHHRNNINEIPCVEQDCIHNVVRNLIGVIFDRLDCNWNDKVTSEDIWQGLKDLRRYKRSNNGEIIKTNEQTNFDIYQCQINGIYIHTSSVSDFVIKSNKIFSGSLTKIEFIRGVLYAYWSRNVDDLRFWSNTENADAHNLSKSHKESRWDGNGLDKRCFNIFRTN